MKKTLAIALGAIAIGAAGQQFRPNTLIWDDPNPVGSAISYRIWDGTNAIASVTTNKWAISGLSPGIHKISVSAVSVYGMEGDMSTNIQIASIVAVINLRLQ